MALIVNYLLLLILLVGCGEQDFDADISDQKVPLTDTPAIYVGSQQCTSCHQKQATLWQGSHHDLAMQSANEKTVLGDFDNTSFDYFGIVSSFYKINNQYYVQTDGPDGKLTDYPIAYTFGVFPLQQYLIKFPKGRYQVLNIAWDARNKEVGGQRWFHLYPDKPVRHDDELHWTGINQNWNHMCADCHSSNLKKNYDAASNEYQTTWSEMNVSCEACHGPGSTHLKWAQLAEETRKKYADSDMGFAVQFDERSGVGWYIDKKTDQVVRSNTLNKRVELDICGRCHSRRQAISSDYQPGAPLLDHFRVSLLNQNLYHADGQVDEEVYVYGSFLQSNMYKMGVTCSDCHEPHSLKLRVKGNSLCGQCHSTAKYDSDQHHHHKTEMAGSQCINCHMPIKNYMVVDARRDHSFRIPRPELSVTVGTPNACNQCHVDKSAKWALGRIKSWYGEQSPQLYAASFSAANHHKIDAEEELLSVTEDLRNPAIVRGTAFSLISNGITQRSLPAIKRAVRDIDPLVRMGLISTLDTLPPKLSAEIGLPLLSDPLKVIRTEAARSLGAHLVSSHDLLESVLAEYKSIQHFNIDRPEALSNLANLALQESDFDEAEKLYKQAIELAPHYVPAYINLADLYHMQKNEARVLELLIEALAKNKQSGALYHALGLAQIRNRMRAKGLSSLQRAYELAPDTARYAYVYAVSLHSEGHAAEALSTLKNVHERFENDQDILFMLASIHLERSEREQARIYGHKLDRLMPNSSLVQALLQEIDD